MQLIVDYNGIRYISKVENVSATEAKDALYKDWGSVNKFVMELDNGGYLILGSDAVQTCAIQIVDTIHPAMRPEREPEPPAKNAPSNDDAKRFTALGENDGL